MLRLTTRLLPITSLSAATARRRPIYAGDLKNKDAKVRLTSQGTGPAGPAPAELAEPYVKDILAVLKDSDAKVRGGRGRRRPD